MLVVLAGCSKQTSSPTQQTQPTATISPSPSSSATAVVTPSPATPVATSPSKTTASTAPTTQPTATPKSNVKTFSAAELAKYDGQNGNPAYVAVNGKVYDVTNVKGWRNGKHEGASAGKDLTKETINSPHGLSALEGVLVVGVYGG